MAFKRQSIAVYLEGMACLEDIPCPPRCFYIPFAESFPLRAAGWTFISAFQCERWPKTNWLVIQRTGQILDFVPANELPELRIEAHVRGKLDYQTDLVVWSSHHGKLSQSLLREFGRNIDGTITTEQRLMLEARLRVLLGAHGQQTASRGRLDLREEIAYCERVVATGSWDQIDQASPKGSTPEKGVDRS